MSQNPDPHADAAVRIEELRLAGQLEQAIHMASQVLVANPRHWQAMGQSIQVLICLGEAQPAARLYQTFTDDPSLKNNLPPEVLVRLAMQLDRRDLLAEMQAPQQPTWLATLLTDGTDPMPDLAIEDVGLRVDNGHPIFSFTGPCPHCSHGQTKEFRLTLVSLRRWVCPACFGMLTLGPGTTGKALRDNFGDQLDVDLAAADDRLMGLVKPRLGGSVEVPFIIKALGQEYHFLLNEFALKVGS